jgi:Radical SAM superfamily/Coenzyme PQQ synthesis protein D (PqqD)
VDLSDDRWRAVVDDATELGVLEAVLTGGEPLLRRDLVDELGERLAGAGVAVYVVTNGWFVDEQVARRLSALRVVVSVDGATPSLHDGARGVPGSWRRAMRAIDLLARRGAAVSVNHVVTPRNERYVDALLEQLWLVGAANVRLLPVIAVGAAAANQERVDERRLRRVVAAFQRTCPSDAMAVEINTVATALAGLPAVPTAMLVRPDGAVVVDSLRPYPLGAVDDGLASCWGRVATAWRDGDFQRRAATLRTAQAGVEAVATQGGAAPRYAAGSEAPSPNELARAREEVAALALARRYRVGPLRWSGATARGHLVRSSETAKLLRLNSAAAAVLEELGEAPAAGAVERLAHVHPDVERSRLERDVVTTVRELERHGVIAPAGATPPAAAVAVRPSDLAA